MGLVRLDYDGSIDDHHPRPQPPRFSALWRRVIPPTTQLALWLYVDGTVTVHDHLPMPGETPPDDVVAGGIVWTGDDASWQAVALANAGYTLTPI